VLPTDLVAVLACPKSKQPLIYFPRGESNQGDAGFLVCPASRLRYRVDAGVPVMLVDEAEELTQAAVTALISRARELGLPVPA
jgi:uncharacterized protein YbaR (Trm112 family)